MAEPGAGTGGSRRLLIITAIVLIAIFGFFLFSFRSCGVFGKRDKGYTVIYSNLELRDSANVVDRLKDLKIPYEIRDKGHAVAVPKEKADQARLGLAEKNLPLGGSVGWEIFDESKLGATDFDRRVQLIRAISGELHRTIRRIEAIEDCRVQIVIPETRLFEAAKAPVTASVLIKLNPGMRLSPAQVNGIIHLVASSVENLQPQNVTIIDDSGKILSAKGRIRGVQSSAPPIKIITKEVIVVKTVEVQAKQMTPEEKTLLRLKAKEEIERQFTVNTQYLLDKFYPPNVIIARVTVDLKEPSKSEESAENVRKVTLDDKEIDVEIAKIYVIALVDNRFNLTNKIKKDTYSTISSTVGYNGQRGDRIILRKVPFYYATSKEFEPPNKTTIKVKDEKSEKNKLQIKETPKTSNEVAAIITDFVKKVIKLEKRSLLILLGSLMGLFIVVRLLRRVFGGGKKKEGGKGRKADLAASQEEETAANALGSIKNVSEKNPEKIANLIKKWLGEEE